MDCCVHIFVIIYATRKNKKKKIDIYRLFYAWEHCRNNIIHYASSYDSRRFAYRYKFWFSNVDYQFNRSVFSFSIDKHLFRFLSLKNVSKCPKLYRNDCFPQESIVRQINYIKNRMEAKGATLDFKKTFCNGLLFLYKIYIVFFCL